MYAQQSFPVHWGNLPCSSYPHKVNRLPSYHTPHPAHTQNPTLLTLPLLPPTPYTPHTHHTPHPAHTQKPSSQAVQVSLQEVRNASQRLQTEYQDGSQSDLAYRIRQIISSAYDVAKAARHLVMCVEQDKKAE